MGSRIGLVAKNGKGKTSLLKLIQGDLQPTSGKIEVNEHAIVSGFSQHHVDQLDMDKRPLAFVKSNFPHMKDQDVFNQLGAFRLPKALALQKISTLSGGQKSRLAFAIIVARRPHILILDEPTNHLDTETVDALIEALKEYKGCVFCVSHDQYFLSKVVNEFWAIGGELRSLASLNPYPPGSEGSKKRGGMRKGER